VEKMERERERERKVRKGGKEREREREREKGKKERNTNKVGFGGCFDSRRGPFFLAPQMGREEVKNKKNNNRRLGFKFLPLDRALLVCPSSFFL